MAIKLQNNKIILKDGKLACECCCKSNNNTLICPNSRKITFSITKEEYSEYYYGGTWNISASVNIDRFFYHYISSGPYVWSEHFDTEKGQTNIDFQTKSGVGCEFAYRSQEYNFIVNLDTISEFHSGGNLYIEPNHYLLNTKFRCYIDYSLISDKNNSYYISICGGFIGLRDDCCGPSRLNPQDQSTKLDKISFKFNGNNVEKNVGYTDNPTRNNTLKAIEANFTPNKPR